MKLADVIVIGGGPAGSSCAWKLREAGVDVLVLDKASFPRMKLCAGWVTPETLDDLELTPQSYPLSFMTFDKLHLHWSGHTVKLPSRQHSIRRFEFDAFLLDRSGASVQQHTAREIHREGADYVIDGMYRCKYLVGAGGTSCPVYRLLFHDLNVRSRGSQTATYEHEFAYDWKDPSCHLWFFDDGLPGYAWYVPKANGFINVGLGGVAERIRQRGGRVQDYWRKFVKKLEQQDLVHYDHYHPKGYSYYLRGRVKTVSKDNACIVGDSVGLATRDMGEGIGPAVRSGLLAARAIISGADYSLDSVPRLSSIGFAKKVFERGRIAARTSHG